MIEESAISHMNEDHADAVRRYAAAVPQAGDGDWKVAAIDTDGSDLVFGVRTLRLAFDEPVSTAADLREALASATARARRG